MYFKTIPLPFNLNQSQVEASLRKAAIKETMSLDFKFKAVDIGTDKIFYGLESEKKMTSFEHHNRWTSKLRAPITVLLIGVPNLTELYN